MRGAFLVAVLLVLFTPACSAIPPKIPDITITLSPSSMDVISPPNQTMIVDFNGTVTLDKLPFVRITVSLTASTGAGWTCSCSPSIMEIVDEQPHSFKCNVTIPEATQNQTTNLTVNAVGTGAGFEHAYGKGEAVIVVHGTPTTKKSDSTGGTDNTETNQTTVGGSPSSQGGPFKLGPLDTTSMALIAVVLVVVAFGVYWVRRKKNARRQFVDGADETYEVLN
jgi:hypothetical protein